MSKFNFTKQLDLKKYGEGAFLEFGLLTYQEVSKLAKMNLNPNSENPDEVTKSVEAAVGLLAEKFVGGKLPGDKGQLVEVTKEDLNNLPVEILTEAMGFLSGAQKGG